MRSGSGKPLTQRRIRAVYNAARTYAANNKIREVTSLLGGNTIGDIIDGNLDKGWNVEVKDLAVFAAKIRDAARTLQNEGDSKSVEVGDVEVNLVLGNGQVRASVKIGDGETRNMENFAKTPEGLRQAMDDTISALYNSFPEVGSNVPYGRSVMRNVTDAYEKLTSQADLDSTNDCHLRNFAFGILAKKAGVIDINEYDE